MNSVITVKKTRRRNGSRAVNIQATSTVVKKTKKNKKKKGRNPSTYTRMASIIANPCHGPLTRSVTEGIVVERLRVTLNSGAANNNCGYVVWFPSYHTNANGIGGSCNSYFYNPLSTSAAPVNSTAYPFGMSASGGAGQSVQDPAAPLIGTGTAFDRARTISACMQLEYLGALSSISGQVAIVKNMPLKAFFQNSTSPDLLAPTVDQIFAYAALRERLQPDGHEVIWRPTDTSSVFRTTGDEHAYNGAQFGPDSVWQNGSATAATSKLTCTDSDNANGILIAWKGVPIIASCITINMVKVVELEMQSLGYAIEPPASSSHDATTDGPEPVNQATSWLDRNVPNWQTRAMKGAMDVASSLISRVYAPRTGVRNMRGGLMPAYRSSQHAIMDADWA